MNNLQIYLGAGNETMKQPHRGCPTLKYKIDIKLQ